MNSLRRQQSPTYGERVTCIYQALWVLHRPPDFPTWSSVFCCLFLAKPSLSWPWPVCGDGGSFIYRILAKRWLFLLQISRGPLCYLIAHLRAASSPPATAHCVEIQPGYGLSRVTAIIMSLLCLLCCMC